MASKYDLYSTAEIERNLLSAVQVRKTPEMLSKYDLYSTAEIERILFSAVKPGIQNIQFWEEGIQNGRKLGQRDKERKEIGAEG